MSNEQKTPQQKIKSQLVKLNREITQIREQQDNQDNKYFMFNEVFSEFFTKIQTTLKRTTELDLMQALKLCYQLVTKHKTFENNKYIMSLVVIQSFIKMGENLALFSDNNLFNMTIKLYISEIINELSTSLSPNRLVIGLSLLNLGLPIWKKQKNHVPEMYMVFENILLYIQEVIQDVKLEEREKDYNQENFTILFQQVVLETYVDIEEENTYELSKVEIQDLYQSFLKILNQTIKLCNTEQNFDTLFGSIIENLKEISPYFNKSISEESLKLAEKLEEFSKGFTLKQKLEVIMDQPLMKIKQLDPRIEEYKDRQKDPIVQRQKINKKIKKEKKQNIRDIKGDQQALEDIKKNQEQHRRQVSSKNTKQFGSFLEDQQKEIKKMKTTQLNIKNHKRHGSRMGGKQQENKVSSSKSKGKTEKMDIPKF